MDLFLPSLLSSISQRFSAIKSFTATKSLYIYFYYSNNSTHMSDSNKLLAWVATGWQSNFGDIPKGFPAHPWILSYLGPITQQIYICKEDNPTYPPHEGWYGYELGSDVAPVLETGIAVQCDMVTKTIVIVDDRTDKEPTTQEKFDF